MKKEVSTPLIIIAIVAVLGVIVGFFVLKVNAPSDVSVPNSIEMKNRMMGSSGKMPAPSAGAPGPGSGNTQERMMQQYGDGGRNRR